MPTFLSIIQDACDEMTVTRPSGIVAATGQTERTLLAHARREGRELVRMANWMALRVTHTFDTVAAQEEYALPADYHKIVVDTEWDRANLVPLNGPLDAPDWQFLKSTSFGGGLVNRRFRIMRSASSINKVIYIDPVPTSADAGETLAFEYMSRYYSATAGGTAQEDWAADTDVPVLDADLFRLGVQVRYRRGRGLDFASEADEWQGIFDNLVGADRPSPTLSLAPRPTVRLISGANVPDTGYGT